MLTINTELDKVLTLVHPCRCPRCENSCNFGSGSLVDEDLPKISEFLGVSNEEFITWFNLNYFLDNKDIESLRQYKNYVESDGKILPGAEPKDLIDENT